MDAHALNLSEERLDEPSSDHHLVPTLQQILNSYSESIEASDFSQSENSVSQLTEFLNSVSDAILAEPDQEGSENQAFQALTEIHRYLTSSSLDQAVIDGLSFELPKGVARIACVSRRCLEIAESVIYYFIGVCSPRDMATILCEALDSPSMVFNAPGYFAPLLSGLAKVFVSIQRRHFELIKESLPVILSVLKAVSSEVADEDTDSVDLFNRSIGIANSIEAVCVKLVCEADIIVPALLRLFWRLSLKSLCPNSPVQQDDEVNEKLRALLGLFVLEIMALASISIGNKASSCLPLVLQLSHFLPFSSLSYSGLLTGCDVDTITSIVLGDDEDDYRSFFSNVKDGASLAVIWGHMFNDVAEAAEEDLTAVMGELQSNQAKRWLAVGMLKHIFSCVKLCWELKKHAINFLLCILDGDNLHKQNNEHMDCLVYMPSLFAAMQAVALVIMHSPDAELRKKAFDALKRLLADVPSSLRFDILKALIQNSDSSSMIAILLDRVREEMLIENHRRIGNNEIQKEKDVAHQSTFFFSAGVLELVELVLRPPKGGPPTLPEYGDAVLAALNLYRFILITESTGKTNFTGVVSKSNLQKAYNDWLLPLRTLVTGIVAENHKDNDQLALHTVCALNPIELVLHRCVELIEEELKCCNS